jgi:hypothetical protein
MQNNHYSRHRLGPEQRLTYSGLQLLECTTVQHWPTWLQIQVQAPQPMNLNSSRSMNPDSFLLPVRLAGIQSDLQRTEAHHRQMGQ